MANKETFVEEQDAFSGGDELSAEKFMEGENNFIKSPDIGEHIEFVFTSVKKQPAKKVKNPKTGNTMDIGLSGDGVDYYYDFISEDGKAFSCSTWQIVGKTKAIIKKLGGKFGVKLQIHHIADGRTIPKDQEAWKVYAEVDKKWQELDRESNEWKEVK